jgi:hypothetical protein
VLTRYTTGPYAKCTVKMKSPPEFAGDSFNKFESLHFDATRGVSELTSMIGDDRFCKPAEFLAENRRLGE